MFLIVSRRFSQLIRTNSRPRLREAKSGASAVLVAAAVSTRGASAPPWRPLSLVAMKWKRQ